MIPKLFGGLLVENLQPDDPHLHLQLALYQAGLIEGVQVALPQPKSVSINQVIRVFNILPSGLGVFIHGTGEKDGFNPGQTVDVRRAYRTGVPAEADWAAMNRLAVNWSSRLAQILSTTGSVKIVMHLGNASGPTDRIAFDQAVQTIRLAMYPELFAWENMCALRLADEEAKILGFISPHWGSRTCCFEIGGTPESMRDFLQQLQPGSVCLIDFSHLMLTVNQAKAMSEHIPELKSCLILERLVENFLALPHSLICHYSGFPDGRLAGSHGERLMPVPGPVLAAMHDMEVICLERRWDPADQEETFRDVEAFKEAMAH